MLKRLVAERFTVFENADLEFSVGDQRLHWCYGTGKTHLMKLAYSILRAWKAPSPPAADPDRSVISKLEDRIAGETGRGIPS